MLHIVMYVAITDKPESRQESMWVRQRIQSEVSICNNVPQASKPVSL